MEKTNEQLHEELNAAFEAFDAARKKLKDASGKAAVLAAHDSYEAAKATMDEAVSAFVERFSFNK